MNLGTEHQRIFRAKKINYITDLYQQRYMLQFGENDNFLYQAINEDGVVLNAISYLSIVSTGIGLKCVGVTDPYRPSVLTVEEFQKMTCFDQITDMVVNQPCEAVYLGDDTLKTIKKITFQTEVLSPSIRGATLVLALNDAYLVEGAE